MFVTDIHGQSEFLVDHSPPQIREVLNGEYGLTFDIYLTHQNKDVYDMVVEESIVTCDGQQFTIKSIDENTVGSGAYKSITAEHIFFTLLDFRIMEPVYYDEEVELVRVMQLFTGNGFNVTYEKNFGSKYIEEIPTQNHLEFLNFVCQLYKVEILRDNKNIIFKEKLGSQSDEPYRYGYNVKTLSRSINTDNLSTIIYGYMDGDMDTRYEYRSPLIDVYGIKIAEPVIADDMFEEDKLMQLLKDSIQDYPLVSYSIEVSNRTHSIGDTVFIVWEPLNIDVLARIVEITKFPEGGGDDIITVSNVQKNSVQLLAEFGKAKQLVDKITTIDGHIRFAAMDEQVQKSTHAIMNSMTELEYPAEGGIIGRSKLDPKDYTIFNSGGFAIFKDGILTEAITVDGFNLTAGVIGKLQSQNIATDQLIVGDNITMGPNAIINWSNVNNKPSIPTTAADVGAMATATYIDANNMFTGHVYAQNITVGKLQASQIATDQLIVGDNIAMGPNAKIAWGNINNPPKIPTTAAEVGAMATATYIDANNMFTGNLYANKITGGLIQAAQIATSQLIVGNNIAMGPNAYISWSNVGNKPFIPTSASDIGAMAKSTYIDANGIFTGQVYAGNITAGTISGVTISGGRFLSKEDGYGYIDIVGSTVLGRSGTGFDSKLYYALSAITNNGETSGMFVLNSTLGRQFIFNIKDTNTCAVTTSAPVLELNTSNNTGTLRINALNINFGNTTLISAQNVFQIHTGSTGQIGLYGASLKFNGVEVATMSKVQDLLTVFAQAHGLV